MGVSSDEEGEGEGKGLGMDREKELKVSRNNRRTTVSSIRVTGNFHLLVYYESKLFIIY